MSYFFFFVHTLVARLIEILPHRPKSPFSFWYSPPPLIELELTGPFPALASQSLSVVSELIPYVRETFRRHLNQAEAVLLVDFDKLKRVRVFGS